MGARQLLPPATADASAANAALNTPPAVTNPASTSVQRAAPQTNDERYQDGIIISKTPDDAKVPFLLRFNINTADSDISIPLIATKLSPTIWAMSARSIRRNDITVNRSMFILGGYIFDKRLRYSFTVWTSAGAASIVRGREHWLAIQQAVHAHGRLHGCSREPIAG